MNKKICVGICIAILVLPVVIYAQSPYKSYCVGEDCTQCKETPSTKGYTANGETHELEDPAYNRVRCYSDGRCENCFESPPPGPGPDPPIPCLGTTILSSFMLLGGLFISFKR